MADYMPPEWSDAGREKIKKAWGKIASVMRRKNRKNQLRAQEEKEQKRSDQKLERR